MIDYRHFVPPEYEKYLSYFTSSELDVGTRKEHFLSYHQEGNQKKSYPPIVITAGFDGDEWDGILAALKLPPLLRERFAHLDITVLPVANPFGLAARTSYIPFDKSFPKHYFPGSLKGNYAQKLVYSLSQKYFKNDVIWIDLHGGSAQETLTPFVSAYETGNLRVDQTSHRLLAQLDESMVFFQTFHAWQKIKALAEIGGTYILSEAGDQGAWTAEMTELHLQRVERMLKGVSAQSQPQAKPLSAMERYFPPLFAYWQPKARVGMVLEKNEIIGEWFFLLPIFKRKIRCQNGGALLWVRKPSRIMAIEPVCEINYRV